MGQLLNRLKNFAKSHVDNVEVKYADNYLKSEDDELKRIIDELNNKKSSSYSSKINTERKPLVKIEYKVLGLNSNDVPIEEIKKAYKIKIKEFHPDKIKEQNEANLRFAQEKTLEINAAYSKIRKERGF